MRSFSFIILFLLFAYATSAQNRLHYSYGFGLMNFTTEHYSYTNYLPDRAPYEVIPPKQNILFFPGSMKLQTMLWTQNNKKWAIGTSLNVNAAAFLSTAQGNDFLALQLPLLISFNKGNCASLYQSEKSWGYYLAVGYSLSRLTGNNYPNKASYNPILELGLNKSWGKHNLEMAINYVYSSRKLHYDDPAFVYADHFKIPGLGIKTYSLIFRYARKPMNNDQ